MSSDDLSRALALVRFDIQRRIDSQRSHFDPNQPRVPAGNPDGGQWTTEGVHSDPRILSDATPDNGWKPGAQYAQSHRRNSVSVRIAGRLVEVEGGQAARLVEARSRAHDAAARVRELDRNWKPRPSAYETVEGLIRTYEAEAQHAQARLIELGRLGIGPGPFAHESIPARGPRRDFTILERTEINRFGYATGCHTCGIRTPGTMLGNFVPDHQPPTALNVLGRSQRLYPQCVACSRNQGLWIAHN